MLRGFARAALASARPCVGVTSSARLYSGKDHPQWEIARSRHLGEHSVEAIDSKQWDEMKKMDYDQLVRHSLE